ncbi:SLC13 family permease [Cohnella suwonensis]|uniref:SLC13 family permease n=1 Tax=Cohnella suwonensis TaxID=696072 RepID=A0ABW0LWD4_9BACL
MSFLHAGYIWQVVWNATLSLIGVMVLTAVMDGNGFFRWAALHIVRRFHDRRLLLLTGLALFSCLITTFFNNDGTILIMTPIVLEATALLGMGKTARIAFLLSVGLIRFPADDSRLVRVLDGALVAKPALTNENRARYRESADRRGVDRKRRSGTMEEGRFTVPEGGAKRRRAGAPRARNSLRAPGLRASPAM